MTGSVRTGMKTTSPGSSAPNTFEDVPCPLIEAAATRVWAEWSNRRGDAVDAEEAFDILHIVALAVADRGTSGGKRDIDKRARSVLGRRFVELLRADLIVHWNDHAKDEPSETILPVLAAIEAVREAIDPDWSEYFSARLAGPDGLDLVVQLAHDLRSPLTSILFLAETLQRGQSGPVSDIQHRQLGLVYGAALGLSSIASDVIELARGGDRLVDDEPTPFSITEVLESVQDIVRPIAAEKGLSIRIRPPASDHRLGHPLALSRVLLNLTTNALKFTDDGYVELDVRASTMTKTEFSVRDTGNGINPDAMESLFQPFRRAKGREGYCFSGTGLGLAICQRLVSAMGSALEVETEPHKGTRFHFVLNLVPVNR